MAFGFVFQHRQERLQNGVRSQAAARGVMLLSAARERRNNSASAVSTDKGTSIRASAERETSQLEILNGHIAHRSERS